MTHYGAKVGGGAIPLSRGLLPAGAPKFPELRAVDGNLFTAGSRVPELDITALGRTGGLRPQSLGAPVGFSESQFSEFFSGIRSVVKSENLPEGLIVAQGSRVRGTVLEDIDVLLVVSDEQFAAFAAQRLSEATSGNRKAISKTVRNQQRINARGISRSLEQNLYDNVKLPAGVKKVQFSIAAQSSPFYEGPFVPIR